MSLFPGASIQRSSSVLELISIIFEWHYSLLKQLAEYNLDQISGYPNFFDKKLLQTLLNFIIHADYEPDRRRAFVLLQRFDTADMFGSLLEGVEMTLMLLNSRHQSQIEAGILVSMVAFESLKEDGQGNMFILIIRFCEHCSKIFKIEYSDS